jgi:hypothetical protein
VSPLIVTEKPVAPADVVEPYGLSPLVADGLVEAKRLLCVDERVGVTALMFGEQAEILVDIGLAEAVTQPLVQPQAAPARQRLAAGQGAAAPGRRGR